PASDFNANPDVVTYHEGVFTGYRYYTTHDVPVRYPFGYGLSYTTFRRDYFSAAVDGSVINVKIRLTNTGDMAGSEVVQIYASKPVSGPKRELVGFCKTRLEKGETKEILLKIPLERLTVYDTEQKRFILPKGEYVLTWAANANDEGISKSIVL
ncbi:MAG: beta-glucosidase, partial [Clostridiaceae bacterium]|nr:beta-glucosidase [Clostridiaceae bacterium]